MHLYFIPQDVVSLLPMTGADRFVALCAEQRWPLHDIVDNALPGPAMTFRAGEHASVTYVFDDHTDVPHVLIAGADRATALTHVSRACEPMTVDELVAGWRSAQTTEDRVAAIYALGLGAPDAFDERTTLPLILAINHSEPAVRRAATYAIGIRRRPEHYVAVHLAWEQETDPDALAMMEALLGAWPETRAGKE